MVNVVYRKIKELSEMEMKPRPAISIDQLMHELNMNLATLKPFLELLVQSRLIIYSDRDKHSVKLTLQGSFTAA